MHTFSRKLPTSVFFPCTIIKTINKKYAGNSHFCFFIINNPNTQQKTRIYGTSYSNLCLNYFILVFFNKLALKPPIVSRITVRMAVVPKCHLILRFTHALQKSALRLLVPVVNVIAYLLRPRYHSAAVIALKVQDLWLISFPGVCFVLALTM